MGTTVSSPIMARLDRVSDGSLRDVSFALEEGGSAKILLASEDRKNELLAALTGLRRPGAGSVFLLGEDLYALKEKERLRLFQRIGVVPSDGGMISNLKAWENMLLPAWYHRGLTAEQAERPVAEIFDQLGPGESGLKQRMGELPDRLSLYERRVVALARAMLMEPDILIYDFTFTGLERDAAQQLMKLTGEFHGRKAGRVSLYLCPDDAVSARLTADQTITLAH
ncbi:MAG: ATP-binding cassette domain-containing protein [Sulfuricaulis sp.]|nr:ATP-binding cassette domain-containing protein [Sulfuricaulis sp.]